MATINSVGNGLSGTTGTGNFVGSTSPTLITPTIGAALATSVNFGGTSLANYQEGTWTPTDASGAGLTLTINSANYRRIGKVVFFNAYINYPITANASQAVIGGLPVAALSDGTIGPIGTSAVVTGPYGDILATNTIIYLMFGNESAIVNSTLSNNYILLNGFYLV